MTRRLIIGVALVCLVATAAQAQPTTNDTPWSTGVSMQKRNAAQKLLEAGNKLFLEKKYREALTKYRDAILSWDHPAIRFNVVRTLIQLDRPVKAYENLKKALAYGKAPLEEQVFNEAKNYERLLVGQIADITVQCSQPGVVIALDGKQYLTCPGKKRARVMPGKHQLVGKSDGFLTRTLDVVLLPGRNQPVQFKLMSLADATISRRRWQPWKPWTMVGAGAFVAGVGLLFQRGAESDFNQYETEIAEQCAVVGCLADDLSKSTRDLESSAKFKNIIGVTGMVSGGAIVVAGLALVILNRSRRVVDESLTAPTKPQLTPTISSNSIGLTIAARF